MAPYIRGRVLLCGTMLLLFGGLSTVFGGAFDARQDPRFHLTSELGGSVSVGGGFVDLGFRASYQPELLGAALEAKLVAGPWRGDSYLLVNALLLDGWVDFGGGASVTISGAQPSASYVGPAAGQIDPDATVGLLIPGFKLGPGELGLNVSLDGFFSDAAASGGVAPALIGLVVGSVKLTGGVNYSFDF